MNLFLFRIWNGIDSSGRDYPHFIKILEDKKISKGYFLKLKKKKKSIEDKAGSSIEIQIWISSTKKLIKYENFAFLMKQYRDSLLQPVGGRVGH